MRIVSEMLHVSNLAKHI